MNKKYYLENLLKNVKEFTENTPCKCKELLSGVCSKCLVARRLKEYESAKLEEEV